jgi:hypothetical protein
MKRVGHDAMVGVLLVAVLAFLATARWERRRAPMRVVG